LANAKEVQELGLAVFLDRPFGAAKAPAEPDQTPLVSYEAYSRSVAERRLRYLNQDLGLFLDAAEYETVRKHLANLAVAGVRLQPAPEPTRPGAVSLQDARKIADDWLLLRTTQKSVRDFLNLFD